MSLRIYRLLATVVHLTWMLLLTASTSAAEIFVVSKESANIRAQPTTASETRGKAQKGQWFVYLGSSPDNRWRNVELPDGRDGWIYYTLGRIEDDNYPESLSTGTGLAVSGPTFGIDRLAIHVINVRQGDSTLVVAHGAGGKTAAMLIDAGKPGRGAQFVVPYLNAQGIAEIAYVIATHPDSDHTGGLDEVIGDSSITLTGKAFISQGEIAASQKGEYDEFVDAVKDETHENVVFLAPPTELPLATGLSIQVVTGGGAYIDATTQQVVDLDVDDANAKSIGLLITFKKFKFFVAGDLGGQAKHQYIENKVAPFVGDIDVLRVSHHGSDTSTHQPFLASVKPEVALISTGSDNNYGHPRKAVIQRLKASDPQMKIYQTEEGDQTSQYKTLASVEGLVSGNLVISTDGNCKYTITGGGAEFNGSVEMTNDDC